jgi:hypothetical protein
MKKEEKELKTFLFYVNESIKQKRKVLVGKKIIMR